MTVTVRFAPSPTGRLHLGNARAAVLNFLFACKEGGRFILRLDDTDPSRSSKLAEAGIVEDMAWLGLPSQIAMKQSERINRYFSLAESLIASGYLYRAYETREELDRKRARQRLRGLPPVYDRSALNLSEDDHAAFAKENRRPHWRFKLAQKTVTWTDLIRGEVTIDTATLSDPVLIREDGQFLYTLPSVVDDLDLKISHVIRGEDHVVNTAAQIEIFEALGGPVPIFAHYPMILGADGGPLSKRLGSLSLESLRDDGIDPMAVNSLLAKIGTSDPIEPRRTLAELAADFAFVKIGHAPARLDPDDLKRLSTKLLHLKPFAEVAPALAALGVGGEELFWLAVHDNLATLDEALEWWRIVAEPLAATIAGDPVLLAAARLLPEGEMTEGSWQPWTKAIAAATGLKGRDLFHPLRLALTGREQGPEMKKLLPLMGRERVLARLRGERA